MTSFRARRLSDQLAGNAGSPRSQDEAAACAARHPHAVHGYGVVAAQRRREDGDEIMTKRQTFYLMASAKVVVTRPIKAESLEAAIEIAKELKIGAFIKPVDEQGFDDVEDFEITGVWK